ncbi:plastocyanin/azurin family copper-binding protein [Mesorhizobium qingshengii]|uniref:Plastocyanin/azurin family copper-binding protein n=1 Tax=Mesorhizobium qingshengii TaxID=1165689 RepID=A0ABT4R486_9HYPH|nr:plastocyanin/azurin family copper-binding protein [Mesorhizobium qingshengii]MCZ8548640.1 plastocyanin/azurin family copper-binding protein [Mesorhizobium qingshengii]
MKRTSRRAALGLAAAMLMAGGAGAAQAASTIKVSLWDKGANVEMPTGLAFATPGMDHAKATMGIKASPSAVKAGEVTFNVKNDSKDTIHEMIVMYMADPTKPLPYVDAENRVDEDKAGDKGEVSELDPGKSGTLTVDLKAGKYLLICNVPGHYGAGMWAEFTVNP